MLSLWSALFFCVWDARTSTCWTVCSRIHESQRYISISCSCAETSSDRLNLGTSHQHGHVCSSKAVFHSGTGLTGKMPSTESGDRAVAADLSSFRSEHGLHSPSSWFFVDLKRFEAVSQAGGAQGCLGWACGRSQVTPGCPGAHLFLLRGRAKFVYSTSRFTSKHISHGFRSQSTRWQLRRQSPAHSSPCALKELANHC